MKIAERVYTLSSDFPNEEKYGLTSQMRRSAVSIASNISEGAGRSTNGEFRNFLSIASGSAYELHTQLILVYRLNFKAKTQVQPIIDEVNELQKMIYGMIKHLKK